MLLHQNNYITADALCGWFNTKLMTKCDYKITGCALTSIFMVSICTETLNQLN